MKGTQNTCFSVSQQSKYIMIYVKTAIYSFLKRNTVFRSLL